MERLYEGLRSFMETAYASEKDLFRRLADGQSPSTFFITCSDSRIDPALITQSQPGDLFVMRNVGNIVPHHGSTELSEAAAIEYAVVVLGVRDVIVCGHSGCGAIDALVHPSRVANLPAVASWLELAGPTMERLAERYPTLEGAERLAKAIELNVLVQLGHLLEHPSVADAVKENRLRLHGWVYDIGTGRFDAFCSDSLAFVPIEQRIASDQGRS